MVSSIGFGNSWQDVKLAPLTLESAAAPHVNNATVTGKSGNPIPAAGMSLEEALYGRPKKESHPIRNTLLGLLGLGAVGTGMFLGAKHYGVKSGSEFISKNSERIVNKTRAWIIDPFKKHVINRVKGWFGNKNAADTAKNEAADNVPGGPEKTGSLVEKLWSKRPSWLGGSSKSNPA